MCTKVLAFLALATIANANDVIVGLKTDGRKFFDENRQANPALWRQTDNVTIKAPENEVIRRIVITDLRPEKDGDVKVVEGGEGQKNVTIELKSPTVLRGYEFHIEVYSTPEENVPFTNDQQGTTEIVPDGSTTLASNDPATKSHTTSEVPNLSMDKMVPAILSNDGQTKNSDRQGRNAKNEKSSSEGTKELTSTTLKSDVSTTPTPQLPENEATTETSDAPKNSANNRNPSFPALSGRDITNDKLNVSSNDETRYVRDTEKENAGKHLEDNLNPSTIKVPFEFSTENDKEASTTEISDTIPVEDKSKDKSKEDRTTASKSTSFNNYKYTSAIPSKLDKPSIPIEVKDAGTQRNVRGANEEQKIYENISSTTPAGSTTTDINDGTSTLSDDCVTTEDARIQNPENAEKDKANPIPVYLNNRQWNQRFNNPIRDSQATPGDNVHPAVLTEIQSTHAQEATDVEHVGNDYKPTQDHMENKNPKISAVANQQVKGTSLL